MPRILISIPREDLDQLIDILEERYNLPAEDIEVLKRIEVIDSGIQGLDYINGDLYDDENGSI